MIKGVPSYAAPHEVGLYLAVETERSFNEMMQSIGIEELHSFEENGVVVLEADAAEASKEKKANKIIQWIKDRWEDLKKLFDQALKGIQNLIETAKKKIAALLGSAKNKESIVKIVDRLKETKKDGSKIYFGKDYQWTEFDSVCKGQSIINHSTKAYEDFAKRAVDGSMNYKDEKDDLDKKVAAHLGIKGELTTAEIAKAINTRMRGNEIEVDKAYLKSNIDKIFESATNYNENAAKLASFLKEVKKAFNNAEKAVKAAARKDKTDENLAGAAHIVREESKFFTAVSSTIVTNVRLHTNNSIRIILRLAIAAKKKEEVKATGESAIVPSSFQTELASLFEF